MKWKTYIDKDENQYFITSFEVNDPKVPKHCVGYILDFKNHFPKFFTEFSMKNVQKQIDEFIKINGLTLIAEV